MTDVARIERIEQLTAEAAEEFAQPVTADLVQLIGALRFAREEMLDRLATGARNPEQISAALIDNGNAIDKLLPAKPHRIDVHFVDGVRGICPKCNARIDDYKAPPKLSVRDEHLERADKSTPPKPERAPRATASPQQPAPTFQKDTRPNAPAPLNGHGGLAWFGSVKR
jgi:hypothetical protein